MTDADAADLALRLMHAADACDSDHQPTIPPWETGDVDGREADEDSIAALRDTANTLAVLRVVLAYVPGLDRDAAIRAAFIRGPAAGPVRRAVAVLQAEALERAQAELRATATWREDDGA